MVDIYALRGYGPIYTIDTILQFPGLGKHVPYKKPCVKQTAVKNLYPKRITVPRRGGRRFEARHCVSGDIVYAPQRCRNTSRINIIPYMVVEVEDCFLWARKKLTDKKSGYYTYLWVRPLVRSRGNWVLLPKKDIDPVRKNTIYNGCGHSVSAHDFGYDSVYLTPTEALGAALATLGIHRNTLI